MANEYDLLLKGEEERVSNAGTNEYDALLADDKSAKSSVVRSNFMGSVDSNPDQYAKAKTFETDLGIPAPVAARNFAEVEKKYRLAQADHVLQNSPAAMNRYLNPEFAHLFHDKVTELADIERTAGGLKEIKRGPIEAITEPLQRGFARARQSVTLLANELGLYEDDQVDLAVRLSDQQRRVDAYPVPEDIQRGLREISGAETFGDALSAIVRHPGAVMETTLESLGASSPSVLAGAAGAAVSGPWGAATGAGLGSFAVEYASALSEVVGEKGNDPMAIYQMFNDPEKMSEAREKGVKRGVPIAIFDALTAGLAGKLLAGAKPTTASIGSRVAGEMGLQAGGGAAGEATAQIVAGENFRWGDVLLEAFAEIPTGAIEVRSNWSSAREAALERQFKEQQVQAGTALRSEQTMSTLIDQVAADPALLERSPEDIKSFITEAVGEEHGEVYINARQLANVFNQEVIPVAETLGVTAQELNEALATGADVRVETGAFVTAVAQNEQLRPLIEHAKVDVGGMSPVEARAWESTQGEAFQKEAEQVMQRRAAETEFQQSANEVERVVYDQLKATGRFTDQTNKAYAALHKAFATVMADRMTKAGQKISPAQFFAEHALGVKSEGQGGFDQAGQLRTDTPEFRNWFGESKVVDESGAPLVVYHGTNADFSEFKTGVDSPGHTAGASPSNAFYFSVDPANASGWALAAGPRQDNGPVKPASDYFKSGKTVYPVYVSIKNPMVFDAKGKKYSDLPLSKQPDALVALAKKKGHDGLIIKNMVDSPAPGWGGPWSATQIVAFEPTQIKSVNNRGTWNPNDPNILNQSEQQRNLLAVHNLSAENLKFADDLGGLAVPSIGVVTSQSGGVEGFGEITLLGGQGVADPSAEPVFSSDAYTARFPKAEWPKAKSKDAMVLVEMVRDVSKEFGDRSIIDETYDNMVNTPDAEKVVDAWVRSYATQALFLREQGVDVKPVMGKRYFRSQLTEQQLEELRPLYEVVNDQQNNLHPSERDTAEHRDLKDKIRQMLRDNLEKTGKARLLDVASPNIERIANQGVNLLYMDYNNLRESVPVDSAATSELLRSEIDKRAPEFKAWVEKHVMSKFGEPFLKVGRKKVPYTLPNIVEVMTSERVKGEEKSMTFGAGQTRAAASRQFSNVEQMREAAKDSIVNADEYKAAKDKTEKLLDEYRTAVIEYTTLTDWRGNPDTWEALDASMRALAKWATSKGRDTASMRKALTSEKFKVSAVPADVIEKAIAAGDALLSAPVPYFEAKPQRAVSLGEFAGAVIPANASQETRDILAKHGIKTVEYTDEQNRTELARKFADELGVLFQKQDQEQQNRGSFDPETNLIALLDKADLSTFLHESGHYFLEVMVKVASEPDAPASIRQDVDQLLAWFGVTGTPEMSALDQWNGFTLEEKRNSHEKFARGFESYLFEGKAPNIELQGVFAKFRQWLINVYRSLTALNVELTDEVRGVFDRMVATDAQIAEAEAVRRLAPIFQTPEQAGMTAEEWAAYQAEQQQATDTAVDAVQARSIRDMRWLSNAKSKKMKELQATAKELRAAAKMAVRREVMLEPVYQAWQFLTGKVEKVKKDGKKSNPDIIDPTQDSLFVAIAKLGGIDKAQLVGEWGIDPADIKAIPRKVFGKPVVRVEKGRTLDDMAEALGQHGYLQQDENGKVDLRDLEYAFGAELKGEEVFSEHKDWADRYAKEGQDFVFDEENVPFGRLNRKMVREFYGDDNAIVTHLENLKMLAEDGIDPDLVASWFGFTSGDEMMRTLAIAQDPKVVIEERTDQRMLEDHGDLASQADIERAAEKAIHNDVRARFLARELNALRKAVGKASVLAKAARQFAEQKIAGLRIRDAVRTQQHAVAEARSGKAASDAVQGGNTADAAAHKRDQLLNHELLRASLNVRDEIQAIVKYFKKFDKVATRKAIDPDYRDQIDQLLERFDFRKVSGKALAKRKSLADWIEAQNAMGLDPVIDDRLLADIGRQHYTEMTVDELRSLHDAIQNIEHLGRLKNRLLTAKKNRDLAKVVAEITQSIMTGKKGSVDADIEKPRGMAAALDFAKGFLAEHRKIASLAYQLDGFKDGGPMWEYFIRSMNEAGSKETAMRSSLTEKLSALWSEKLKGVKLSRKEVVLPGISLSREGIISMALNVGNEGNRQRILDGGFFGNRPISEAQLQSILDRLTQQEWEFVQGVWDLIESNRPAIAEQEKRLTGITPKWVEPTPVHTRFGTFRGGYYPAKYDANLSTRSNELEAATDLTQQMKGARGRAATRNSYTKDRAQQVVGRPLRKDLGVLVQHLNEVSHRLAWQDWLIDTNRLLSAGALDAAIREKHGVKVLDQLRSAVKDIAQGDAPAQGEVDRAIRHMRQGTSIAGLGWNVMTSLLQPIGLTQSMVRVGAGPIARGMRQFLTHPMAATEEVQAKSDFMANRFKTFNRELNELLNKIDNEKMSKVQATYFILIQKMQQLVDVPTWLGAYDKALRAGEDESRARALADQAVIDSQGDGQVQNLSAVQRGGEWKKALTNFYSFFNVLHNLAVERGRATDFKHPLAVANLAVDYLLLFTVPALFATLMRHALKGGDWDDEEELLQKIIGDQVGYLLGTMFLLREAGGGIGSVIAGDPFNYGGPAAFRAVADIIKLGKQVGQGEVDMPLIKATINVAGVVGVPGIGQFPSGAVNRAIEGVVETAEGNAPITSVLFGQPPK